MKSHLFQILFYDMFWVAPATVLLKRFNQWKQSCFPGLFAENCSVSTFLINDIMTLLLFNIIIHSYW